MTVDRPTNNHPEAGSGGRWDPGGAAPIMLPMKRAATPALDDRGAVEPEPAALALPPAPARVVLADDHPLYRDGLSRALGSRSDLVLVGEAADGVAALALIEELAPDVALLDVQMPGLDGIDVCRRVTRQRPELPTRVLLLSAHVDEDMVARGIAAGASGYLGKDASRRDIGDAVANVASGRGSFAGGVADGVVAALERLLALEPRSPGQAA